MYMFLLSQEPDEFRLDQNQAARSHERRAQVAAPQITELAAQFSDDDAVVGRPLEVVFVDGDWHRGRVVLIGDAVHASTPHLAQGAGMAIEDGLVLAEELERADSIETAFKAYRDRRFDRTRFVAKNSIASAKPRWARVRRSMSAA